MRIERDESGRIIRFYQDDGSDIHVEGKDLPAIIDAIGRYESETYSKVTDRILGAKKINSVNIKNGIDGLKSKTGKCSKKGITGRPKKAVTREEELERENVKLKIEIARLKKGYYVKGVGQRKEYVSINNKSIKSSKN